MYLRHPPHQVLPPHHIPLHSSLRFLWYYLTAIITQEQNRHILHFFPFGYLSPHWNHFHFSLSSLCTISFHLLSILLAISLSLLLYFNISLIWYYSQCSHISVIAWAITLSLTIIYYSHFFSISNHLFSHS